MLSQTNTFKLMKSNPSYNRNIIHELTLLFSTIQVRELQSNNGENSSAKCVGVLDV
jgi:hypothetical protein